MESIIAESMLEVVNRWVWFYERKIKRRYYATLTKRMIKSVKTHFKQRERILLMKLEREWYRIMENKAEELTSRIMDLQEEEALLINIFHPYYVESGEAGSVNAIRVLMQLTNRDIVYKGSKAWIEDNAIRFSKKYARTVSKTTNEKIRNEISKAISKGDDLDALMKNLKNVYRGVSDYRAEMIGRTEIGRSYDMSGLIQDRALGIKEYDMVGCDDDCPECGPFMAENPHTAEEMEDFIMNVHPNHKGNPVPRIPKNFEPELYA